MTMLYSQMYQFLNCDLTADKKVKTENKLNIIRLEVTLIMIIIKQT